jgi:hypothetical protein
MIATMLALLASADAAVSICFHAGYLHADWPRLKSILKETDYTFTVWGKVGDAALLSWIRAHTPPERCFYDMQNEDGSRRFTWLQSDGAEGLLRHSSQRSRRV